MKRLLLIPLWLLVLVTIGSAIGARADEQLSKSITAQRLAYNKAMAERSVSQISSTIDRRFAFFSPYVGSIVGAEKYIQSMKQNFRERPDEVVQFVPERIEGFKPWKLANETGAWRATWKAADGKVQLRGHYFASWTAQNGSWTQQALIVSPDHCEGSNYCTK